MSNLIGIPSADYYETRLANMWNGTNGTVYVEKVPNGSMPVSEYSYIVVNPGEVNMQVAKIDGWDSDNDTFNVVDVAIPSGAGTYYNATNHPVGSVVRFSNNYAFWKDIQEAINGKLDITSLAPVAVSNDYNDLCNTPTIPTDNCQLANGCGYTTCTGTVTATDLQCYAQCTDIPDVSNLAQCCDIPTDNCELSNSCGYITGINCTDVTSALGYTPYSNTNPNGYTTCTGTLVASDITNLAQCCDIPTDNCQLNNGCGYTTCTGTITATDLACYTKCCDMPNMSCYQTKSCMVCSLSGADDTHYPTAKTVADALSCAGAGDMLASVYDPNGCSADAFDYCNMYNKPTIPTNNNQLTNGCGYTTCTGTLTSSDLANYAQCCDLSSKQDTLTAGENIKISSNTISANNVFIITEDDVTVTKTATKGVSPYNTSYYYTDFTISADAGIEWREGAIYTFVINTTMVVASAYRNVRVRIGDGAYIPVMGSSTILSGSSYFVKAQTRQYQYSTKYQNSGALHLFTDNNTTYTINYSIDAGTRTAGTGKYALSRYSLVMQKPDLTWEKITATSANYSVGTSKSVNTNGFLLGQIRYYYTTAVYANGATIPSNYLYNKASSVDLRYSTNCGDTTTLTAGDQIYLVGTIGADGLFYLDTTQWWANSLPNSADGKLYIRIGIALATSGYTSSFLDDRPIYYYDNGIKVYQQADNKQDTISDLDTIRSNAALGATALQSGDNISCLCNNVGYTTCTGTLSSCADVISALGYTPYNSSNPSGYTTCTGTVVASDLTPYAKSCDLCTVATTGKYCDLTGTPTIPTNNCELTNGCGYTTCTGTLTPANIACINGCCLTNGGNVCIDSGGGGTVMCETSYDPGDYKQDFLYFTY